MGAASMSQPMIPLHGTYPAVPTPFGPNGTVTAARLMENPRCWPPARGFAVLESNGELALLDKQEKLSVIECARSAIQDDRLLLVGTGCQGTEKIIGLTRIAASMDANAALIAVLSYFGRQMTSPVLVRHFLAIADSSPISIIILNVSACTAIAPSGDEITAVAEHSNVIGIKDSGGDLVELRHVHHIMCPDCQVLPGSENSFLPALSMGGVGGIFALANIAPHQRLKIQRLFPKGAVEQAREIQVRLIALSHVIARDAGVLAPRASMDMPGSHGGQARPPRQSLYEHIKQILYSLLTEPELLQSDN